MRVVVVLFHQWTGFSHVCWNSGQHPLEITQRIPDVETSFANLAFPDCALVVPAASLDHRNSLPDCSIHLEIAHEYHRVCEIDRKSTRLNSSHLVISYA